MLLLFLACGPKTGEIAAPDAVTQVSCDRPEGMFGPVVREGDFLHSEATSFADFSTSPAAPAEVCMVEGQLDFLTRVTCADGSSPFGSREEAHGARTGNVGPGGRCGSIIDLYVVPCPEASYEVHIDLYACPGS